MNQCTGKTKKGTRCKNTALCQHHIQGEGFKDFISGIVNRVKAVAKGVRTEPSSKFQSFLDTAGSQPIEKIEIARKPINSNISKLLNTVSFGGFEKVKKKMGYDQIYHNFLLVTIKGVTYKVEKNHIVQETIASKEDKQDERYDLHLPNPSVTMKQLINKSADKDLFVYDAKDKSCQHFTQRIIEENNLKPYNTKAQEVINPQNSKALIDSLGILAKVPRIITDAASIADRAITGDGILPKGYSHHSHLFKNMYHK